MTIPRQQSSMHIAVHAPYKPMDDTSTSVSGMRTIHTEQRFSTAGTSVSPAPRSTPADTMAAPNKGSAHISIRMISTPNARTE